MDQPLQPYFACIHGTDVALLISASPPTALPSGKSCQNLQAQGLEPKLKMHSCLLVCIGSATTAFILPFMAQMLRFPSLHPHQLHCPQARTARSACSRSPSARPRSCAGLSLLNLSLDTLRPDRFEQMTRRRGHERVLETLDLALSLGFDPVKVRLSCQSAVRPHVPAQSTSRSHVSAQSTKQNPESCTEHKQDLVLHTAQAGPYSATIVDVPRRHRAKHTTSA